MRHSLSVFLLLTLTACSLFSPAPEGDAPSRLSAEETYTQAKAKLNEGDFEAAIKQYEDLQSRYPYGRYAQQAMIEIAYAYYRQGEAESSVAAAERFIKQYPKHQNIDYVYYLKGLANFHGEISMLGSFSEQDPTERDPKAAQDSFDAFKELVTLFPDSKYAPDARVRMQYLVNALAKHELHVARYYQRRGAYIAAVNRAQAVLVLYPGSPATRDALEIMVQGYDALGMDNLRDDAKRVLAQNSALPVITQPGVPEDAAAPAKREKRWWQFWK